MSQRFQSTMILTLVFVVGLGAGVSAMVWAWPAMAAHFNKPTDRRAVGLQFMKDTLKLTPQQIGPMEQVFKESQDKSIALDQQYQSRFAPVCAEYAQIRTQENEEFAPVRQVVQNEIRAILTDSQWQTYQKQREQFQKEHPGGPGGVRMPGSCGGGPGHGPGGGRGQVGGPGGPDHQPDPNHFR